MSAPHPIDPAERVPAPQIDPESAIPFEPASGAERPGDVRAGSSAPPRIEFEPAVLRPRHDGWTAQKQIEFIEILSATKCVDEACRRVGMSDTSAYALRRHLCGHHFARAWDLALEFKIDRLEQAVIDRAIEGVRRPVFYKGEEVGEYRHFDERLAMFLLRSRRPWRYGKPAEYAPPPGVHEQEQRRWDLFTTIHDIASKAPRELGNEVTDWTGRGCDPEPDDDEDEEDDAAAGQ